MRRRGGNLDVYVGESPVSDVYAVWESVSLIVEVPCWWRWRGGAKLSISHKAQ